MYKRQLQFIILTHICIQIEDSGAGVSFGRFDQFMQPYYEAGIAAVSYTHLIPVLRWPGGCFTDEYHWKDGIGPKETRQKMIKTHWGGVVEDNSFGTHEFIELCEQLGCEAYVNGNVGSGKMCIRDR